MPQDSVLGPLLSLLSQKSHPIPQFKSTRYISQNCSILSCEVSAKLQTCIQQPMGSLHVSNRHLRPANLKQSSGVLMRLDTSLVFPHQ